MDHKCRAFDLGKVRLDDWLFQSRFRANLNYVMSLKNENLLQNFMLEAGMGSYMTHIGAEGAGDSGEGRHWGWESPSNQLRGHFLGHWLSAAAKIIAATGNEELKLKADDIVTQLGWCQEENGGGWAGSIPEKYLDWIARGHGIWAPHYTLHKTLMGLVDMHKFAGSEQALDILEKFASWFHRWTEPFSREKMDDILDFETGGMMEAFADLYGITGKQEHLDLVERYTRRRLFGPLLEGKDYLTNMHANTTIPEVHGIARAYEVTGNEEYRRMVEAYWKCAVTDRGTFCTGGQTSGEVWTPPFEFAARLGDKNQEHCTVYNMIRLADTLYRWTGDVAYADYIERNIYNGILAQQHPHTGMIDYFLALAPGSTKLWGTPTNDFWCCHGTLVQAHTVHNAYVYYETDDGLDVCQYIATGLEMERDGVGVVVQQSGGTEHGGSSEDNMRGAGERHRRNCVAFDLTIKAEKPVEFALRVRLPWWLSAGATILVNGEPEEVAGGPSSFHVIRRTWSDDTLHVELPKTITASPIPDEPNKIAFMDGPVVLAGLCDEERTLVGDVDDPASMLAPDNERQWGSWLNGWRAVGQDRGLQFAPLHEIVDEPYTVYFPIRGTG